jgi:DNA replication protein DnaC
MASGSSKLRFQADPGLLRIPRRFMKATVDSITHTALKGFAQNYIVRFDEYYLAGKAPALFGKPGLGKTFVAAAIANGLVNSTYNVPVFWADTIDVLYKLIDYRDLHRTDEYFSLRRKLFSSPVVVLDDFGQLRDFARIRELFFQVVNHRYGENLPTIFTANFPVGKKQEEWAGVDQCFSSALTRRIYTMSEGLVFVG